MITVDSKGGFPKLEAYLKSVSTIDNKLSMLDSFGREGVAALRSATPVRSGATASSWDYKIVRKKNSIEIVWTNSNVVHGVPIAVIIQYGHGTGTGGYVSGIDYINPAIRGVFEGISKKAERVVKGQ